MNMNPPWVYTCSPSWTPLPPPSPCHPSESSQCTSPEHPVSCIKPGLAIHFTYDIIHISMPFSQTIPPFPSLTESKRLFHKSVSLFCLSYRVIVTIFAWNVPLVSLIFFFFNLNLFILIGGWLLYKIVLVLPYINMNPSWVYTCSPSWTPLPPPSPYHPSGSSQCTSPKHPVSCIKPGLVIRFLYDIIHVSMPFSQIICWWPLSLLPYLAYCKQCSYKHGGACIFLK